MNTDTIDYLTQDELRQLLRVIDSKRDRAIFLVAYFYGLRASEIGTLKRDDLDLERMKIRISWLKNSISSEFPLRPEPLKALKTYLRTRKDNSLILFPSRQKTPITRRMLDYLMKRYSKHAKIPKDKRHFHVLKHSIATHMLEHGADIMVIEDWIGHRNIRNTQTYTHLINTTRDKHAEKVFASLKIV